MTLKTAHKSGCKLSEGVMPLEQSMCWEAIQGLGTPEN